VDDESTVRTTGTRILERFGYSVIVATDGNSALSIFARASDQIDIVLLDMMMPTMDGKEVFSKLCDIRDDVKVILMSGYQEAEVRGRFETVKPAGFLQKPFSASQLISQIRQIQDVSEEDNQSS
jgi:two-component system, cell cycle sensor histidine kinase and response regulator CckA